MSKHALLLAGASASAIILFASCAGAQTSAATDSTAIDLVVTADRVGLLEKKPNDTVLGLDKPLIETPRSASFVSDVTLERYGITNIDSLVAVSPSAYTGSYYGVPGSLNIRGTLAENYFLGFKRLENRGTYSTPIGDAAQIEIVRGPPMPIYGAGKVGGFLNFIPKTAKDAGKYLSAPTGELTITGGAYNKKNATAQFGAPLNLGSASGGVYVYGEIDDSHSYYYGIHPRRQLAEVSTDFDLGSGWSISTDYMFYHSTGDVQTPGWNRLTQQLIDDGTYITGRDTKLADLNGDGHLSFNEISPGQPNPYNDPFFQFQSLLCFNQFFCANGGAQTLDTGVGTTKLSPRQVYFAPGVDFSKSFTNTAYLDIGKTLTSGSNIKLQGFFDGMSNDRYVSYGFPASYRAYVGEVRLTYDIKLDSADGMLTSKSFLGGSYRYTHSHKRESFNSGVISLDRRDLSFGPTPTDLVDSPFFPIPATGVQMGWENDVHSNTGDGGVFFTTDVTLLDQFDLIVGGRWDNYSVDATNNGVDCFCNPTPQSADKDKFTYSASLSWKSPVGLIPYFTYAKSAALEVAQADDIDPALIPTGAFLSTSRLTEAGLKFQLLKNTLVGALSVYRQERTRLSQGIGSITVVGTQSKGVELEVRWLATKNLSFTFAGDLQHTTIKGPDHSFVYLPARGYGVAGIDGFGGAYVTFDLASFTGNLGNYENTLVPHSVASLYANYVSDDYEWGHAGLTIGGTRVTKTVQPIPNPITFPEYYVFSASAFVAHGPWELDLNVDNLTDELYFTPSVDSYIALAAVPSVGRTWSLTLKRKF